MIKRKALLISLCAFTLILNATQLIPYNSKNITYMGRTDEVAHMATGIYWPGTSVTIKFKGSEVKGVLQNVTAGDSAQFYVIVDGNDRCPLRVTPTAVKSSVVLASGLVNKEHTVQLFKLSNNTSATLFYGFEFADDAQILLPDELPQRKIEFYGNSITAGHGVDVLPGNQDSGASAYFNNYLTYAATTARYFNAQYSCIARSGIGIMVSWFPQIMPEIYDRINPFDPQSKWDFSKFTPQIVVINLFQNDSWIVNMHDHPQFKARFGDKAPQPEFVIQAYQNFVSTIRSKYPAAHIICALGSMDITRAGSPWPGYVEKAVRNLDDPKIYTCFFPYKNTDGHPKVAEQKQMADILIKFIGDNIKW